MATLIDYSAVSYYDKGISSFSKALLPLEKFSTKFEQDEVNSSTISVPIYDATVQVYDAVNGYVPTGSITECQVPLTHVHVTNAVDVSQASKNPAATLGSFYNKQLSELAGGILEKALSGVSAYTAKVNVPSASFTFNVIKSGQGLLDSGNANGDRVVLTAGLWNSALSPSSSDGTKVSVQDYGFTDKMRAPLPATIGAACIAAPSYAVAIGLPTNPLKGTNALIAENVITDPETNITVLHTVYGDATRKRIYSTFEAMVGGKVAINNGGYLVTGAA